MKQIFKFEIELNPDEEFPWSEQSMLETLKEEIEPIYGDTITSVSLVQE